MSRGGPSKDSMKNKQPLSGQPEDNNGEIDEDEDRA
jgi:hypothetical protein